MNKPSLLEPGTLETGAGETTPAKRWSSLTRVWQARNFSLILLFAASLIVSTALSPFFLTRQNIESGLVNFFVELAIVTIGQALVLLIKGIDLSVGGMLALSATGVGFCHTMGFNIWVSAAIGLLIGATCGLLNGVLVTRLRTPPIIATLGSGILFSGITLGITGGKSYSNFPAEYQQIGQGNLGPLPAPVVILAVVAILVHVIMTQTRFGTWLYAIGGNEVAARFSGIPVQRTRMIVYCASGVLAAISGIIMSARFLSAGPLLAVGVELGTITAALLGGVSIAGGQGTIAGALLGMLVIATLQNGLTLGKLSNSTQNMIVAGLLIVVVTVETFLSRRRVAG